MTPFGRQAYRVLVVDDDPSVRGTYRRILDRSGYRCLVEGSPLDALRHDGDTLRCVDLVLLDYRMPEMDGLSFLAELRRKECRAPCVLISAFLNEEVRQQARLLGVDRVLEKPVDLHRLRHVLAELLPESGRRPASLDYS